MVHELYWEPDPMEVSFSEVIRHAATRVISAQVANYIPTDLDRFNNYSQDDLITYRDKLFARSTDGNCGKASRDFIFEARLELLKLRIPFSALIIGADEVPAGTFTQNPYWTRHYAGLVWTNDFCAICSPANLQLNQPSNTPQACMPIIRRTLNSALEEFVRVTGGVWPSAAAVQELIEHFPASARLVREEALILEVNNCTLDLVDRKVLCSPKYRTTLHSV